MRGLQIEHLLRVMIVVVVLLATALFSLGAQSAVPLALTIGVILVAWYLTDSTGRFRLNQPMADCLALVAVLFSAASAYVSDRPGQMIAVGNLQSYLQYVVLFQRKTPRVYWQLALLSLGQVAIASTLVLGPIFAVMLLAYLFSGIVTFSLLLLHSQGQHCTSHDADEPAPAATMALFGNAESVPPRAIIGGIARQAALVSAFSVAVAAVLFFCLPRWNVPDREVASNEPLRSVGFAKTVTLGELGEVVNNSAVVMRTQFFDALGTRPFKVVGEPLFRGTVVTRYDGGTWSQINRGNIVSLPVESQSPYVRQHIVVEPLDVNELFCILPVFALKTDIRLKMDANTEQLVRQDDNRRKQLEFDVGTTGIVDSVQRMLIPSQFELEPEELQELLQVPPNTRDGRDPIAGLRAAAAGVLQEKNVSPADRVAASKALNEFLGASGRYAYSLDPQRRDEGIDPLEDFVTRHRAGHCEYFAGALAMMLRTQGIPARVAIGFKGGEWNSLGMYYQVQQLHAHTWVEVYLPKNQIPAGSFAEDEAPPETAWLVLDPTEGTQELNPEGQGIGILASLRQYTDYAHVLWMNYVVGLNPKRQQQGIFEPIAEGASAAVDNVISRQVWQSRVQALANSPLGTFWQWYRRHWFSWRGGLVAICFSAVVILPYLAVRHLVRTLRRLGLGSRRAGQEPPVLEMYRRLEAALARRGLQRRPAQTAYEFAVSAGGELAEDLEHQRIAHLPRRIVESFYRVRFGGRALDNQEATAIEHALAELELALGSKGGKLAAARAIRRS